MSLPGDLLDAKVSESAGSVIDGARGSMAVADADVRRLRELLEAARRPLILLGPAMARPARRAAVEWLHMATNRLSQADLVLLLGKRLDFAVRFGGAPSFDPACRFVQVDWDAGALDRSGRVTLGLVTDPALLAVRLAADTAPLAGRWRDWGTLVAAARAAGRARPCIRYACARGSSRCSTAAPFSSPTAASSGSGCRRAARRGRG